MPAGRCSVRQRRACPEHQRRTPATVGRTFLCPPAVALFGRSLPPATVGRARPRPPAVALFGRSLPPATVGRGHRSPPALSVRQELASCHCRAGIPMPAGTRQRGLGRWTDSISPPSSPTPGGTGGGSPLSGFRRDGNPGATHRPAPVPAPPQHPSASDKMPAGPARTRGGCGGRRQSPPQTAADLHPSVSTTTVTGPSFTRCTCIIAWKTPVATGRPRSFRRATNT